MITPAIEEMILKGDAEYRNQTIFSSAAGTIICPENKTIVLLDLNVTCASKCTLTNGLFSSKFYGVTSRSQNVLTAYIPGWDSNQLINGGQYTKDIFFLYNESCRIDIAIFDINVGGVDFNPMAAIAKDLPEPVGFGTTVPVTKAISLSGAGDIYIAQGLEYTDIALTATMRNDPFPELVAGSPNVPPAIGAYNEGWAFNIGYAILNIPKKQRV